MRIAQIGNLCQPVPATEYGGTQRVIAQISACQAVLFGHDITVYAAADSSIIDFTRKLAHNMGLRTQPNESLTCISIFNKNGRGGKLRLEHADLPSIGYNDENEHSKHLTLFAKLVSDDNDNPFDVIHNHHRWFMSNAFIPSGLDFKTITHQHNIVLEPTYELSRYPIICISKSQQRFMQESYNANVQCVIYHGIDQAMYRASDGHNGYLAWIGRFISEKGAHRAINIARKANIPLLLAGTIFDKKPESKIYFEQLIQPQITIDDGEFLNGLQRLSALDIRKKINTLWDENRGLAPVIFCGPVNEQQKQTLLEGAIATLFPISWAEPFGLVMIESMACGTPVIAYEYIDGLLCGAASEVVEEGVSGFLIDGANEEDAASKAVEAVKNAAFLDRKSVHQTFVKKWTATQTAMKINSLYRRMFNKQSHQSKKQATI